MSSVSLFLEAFVAAARDKALEQQQYKIYHFFDSDFLHRVIFGFRDDRTREFVLACQEEGTSTSAAQRLLMAALFAQRIRTPIEVRALSPHLHELLSLVRRSDAFDYPGDVNGAIELLGLKQLLRGLAGDFGADREQEFIKGFIELGPTIFYSIEMLSGTWRSRLGRVLALGVQIPSPFEREIESIVGTTTFAEISRYVAHDPRLFGPGGSMNALRDAMSLAMLAEAVNSFLPGDKEVARFYTESPRILSAWRESRDFRELLTYAALPEDVTFQDDNELASGGESGGVFRNEYYYLIRALIPELGYDDEAAPVINARRLYVSAEHLLRARDTLQRGGVSGAELASIEVGSKSLADYVQELTDLSSYGGTWERLVGTMPAQLPAAILKDLRAVIKGEKRWPGAIEALFAKQLDELALRTEEVAAFSDVCLRVQETLSRVRGGLRPRHGSYVSHVGLARWGFEEVESQESALRDTVRGFEAWGEEHSGEEPKREAAISQFPVDLARRLYFIGSSEAEVLARASDTIAILGVFWLLGDTQAVVDYGNRLLIVLRYLKGLDETETDARPKRVDALGGALENMVVAARLSARLGDPSRLSLRPREDRDQLRKFVEELLGEVAAARLRWNSSHEATAIAEGYICFAAWQQMNDTELVPHKDGHGQNVLPELIQRSYDVVLAALRGCDRGSVIYPWLVNHCLYVAALGMGRGLELRESSEELLLELVILRSTRVNVWNYRFDDTLGYWYYARAAESLKLYRDGRERGMLSSALADLEQAKPYFDKVPVDIPDSEITSHRSMLYELEVQLRLQQ